MIKPQLEQHTISDSAAGYSRTIRLLRGTPGHRQRLCLFLDGELYVREMNAVPVLQALIDRGAIPQTTLAFIDHANMKAREQDYTCSEPYGRFIVETVLTWLQQAIPGLQTGQCLIGGLSLSGLMSAWLALRYPGEFRYCLSQSGSFWWHGEHFTKTVEQHAPISNRFWLSVGDQETEVDAPPEVSQIVGVKDAHRALKAIGATIRYHEYHGGHDLKYWREELDQALPWLFDGHND